MVLFMLPLPKTFPSIVFVSIQLRKKERKEKMRKEIYWSPRAAYEASEIKESFDEIPRRAFSIEVTLRTRRRARWKEEERFTPFVAIDTFVQQMRGDGTRNVRRARVADGDLITFQPRAGDSSRPFALSKNCAAQSQTHLM